MIEDLMDRNEKIMITSVKNEKVKEWRKLHKRKGRTVSGTFLVEGYHLVEEAWKSGWKVKEIILAESADMPSWAKEMPIESVTASVFQHISQTETPQGIAAVVHMAAFEKIEGDFLVLIDSIQDPGNLGTIIRTADAAGVDGIVIGKGTVDLFNDKVLRSTQGSVFHLPVVQKELLEFIPRIQKDGFQVLATALENAVEYTEVGTIGKTAVMLGNEGAGVNEGLLSLADKIVHIPIYGQAESLNVSVAAGILMYHLRS
ncbi:TrmH family RNA methyltransferase [Virgibacillus xinjiangensis]|uniref:TrmH family RNA methyltransferase n=1 Tax=Virgibacillus xinjiangensis TaxID=393090 RepID=A0ABV7CUM9_9BACI